MERSSGAPYGIGVRDAVIHDNVMWLRTIALCKIHHAVGDAFSIEHIFPTLALEFEETKELMALPGVFLITFDNCVYGEIYRHRQCLITNQTWLAWLSRDCPGLSVDHAHAMISDDGIPTKNVSPYAWQLVRHWAKLFKQFISSPQKLLCPFCAQVAGQPKPLLQSAKRAVERCLRASNAVCVMDEAKLATDSSGNEDFCDEDFVIERNEAVLRVSVCSTQLGARTKKALKSQK